MSTLWYLNNPGAPGSLTLQAGNNLNVDSGAGIDSTTIDPSSYWNINLAAGTSFVPSAGQPVPDAGADSISYNGALNIANGNVNLFAANDIEISSKWAPGNSTAPSLLSLEAGNSLILDGFASISTGKNWNVNILAGVGFDPTITSSAPASGTDGVYLNGSTFIQTQDGNINVWAANEVQINPNSASAVSNGIRTMNGGNINVIALFGDVNTGGNLNGFTYTRNAPFSSISPVLGGISTAAGGNVNITAGGDVISYLPAAGIQAANDAGTGAFGPEAGNVTVTAGDSVYGHYVVANGIGSITAGHDIGVDPNSQNSNPNASPFALSLINGSWTVNAPNGNIFLQEVRNPNGVFNKVTGLGVGNLAGSHLFNYGAQDSVTLNAYGVFLTDANIPRPNGDVPVLYPSILNITAGAGGVTLGGNVTLFPSPDQNLTIVTTDGGSLISASGSGTASELLMSDSSQTRWVGGQSTFSDTDHGGLSAEPTDPNPVSINISGNMENLTLITTKATDLTIGGDMINCAFSGQNLHGYDTTKIDVHGQIFNQGAFAFVNGVSIPAIPAADLPLGYASSWDNVFTFAVNPAVLANLTIPPNITSAQYFAYAIQNAALFPIQQLPTGQLHGTNPGFVYNPVTGRLGFGGPMPQNVVAALTQPITVLHLVKGQPVLDANGHFETDTISWAPPALGSIPFCSQSFGSITPKRSLLGYRIGGPGTF